MLKFLYEKSIVRRNSKIAKEYYGAALLRLAAIAPDWQKRPKKDISVHKWPLTSCVDTIEYDRIVSRAGGFTVAALNIQRESV